MEEDNWRRKPEKIRETGVKKEKGYLYYIDAEGDVSRVPAKWNKDPKFIEKVDEVPEDIEVRKIQKGNSLEDEFLGLRPLDLGKTLEDDFAPKDENLLYSDKACEVRCKSKALTTGHLRVTSLGSGSIFEVPDETLNQIMTISSISASLVFEGLKAQGTNIIVNTGLDISVIPRFENDNLDLFWEMKQGDQKAIAINAEKIKDKLVIGEKKDFSKVEIGKKVNIVDPSEKVEVVKSEKNYMIDQLRRLP